MNTVNFPLRPVSRRDLLASAAISAVALAAGAGLAGCDDAGQKRADAAKLAAFWALRLPSVAPVAGGEVVLAALRGRPLLVNFWATWCPPCVAELPLLSRFYAERGSRDWQCIGLAAEDRSAPVAQFLARVPVAYPVALAGLAGVQVSQGLGNVSRGLPFTVLFDADGRITRRKIGQLQLSDLSSWLG